MTYKIVISFVIILISVFNIVSSEISIATPVLRINFFRPFKPALFKKTLNKIDRVRRTPHSRVEQELSSFLQEPPSFCSIKSVSSDHKDWVIKVVGPEDSIYDGETFMLKLQFPTDYPFSPPILYFVKERYNLPTGESAVTGIPKHAHIYSNGDICLSLLGKDWRPSMTAESIIVSVVSMLMTAKSKIVPPDNALHSDYHAPGQKQSNWMYHDTKC